MKIALVKRRCSLKHGGSERYGVLLARALMSRGHDVTVIGEQIDAEVADKIPFVAVPVNRLTSWTGNRSFAENSGRAVQAGKYDIAYGLGRALGLDAVRVTERLQSHWVDVRYRPAWWSRLQRWNPRHRTLIGLERTIYRSDSVRRIVTQSQLDRQLVIEHYGISEDKIRTVYNGVDLTTFHPGVRAHREEIRARWNIPPDAPLLLFASMDFEGKGLRSILQALSRVRERNAMLLVLGSGPVRRFRKIADSCSLGDRVIFAGRQDGIERFYGAAELFLLPTAYEPFPNVNLESMACGTPVLTTATSGVADIIREGENGYLLSDMRAVDEIVAKVDRHLSLGEPERQRMAAACLETARAMPLEKNIEQTIAVFEEVLREKFRV